MTFSAAPNENISEELFEGDTGSFPLPVRQLLVKLLRGPYLDGALDPTGWQLLLDSQKVLAAYFAEIFLKLQLDMDRKVAMLAPVETEYPHTTPIAPRRPLKRDETLLALRLRLLLEQHHGTGSDAVISRAAMHDILAEHRGANDRDDKRFAESCEAAIARLFSLRLLTSTQLPDELRISPALAMALPLSAIQDIPGYIAAIEANDNSLSLATTDDSFDEAEQSDLLVQE